MCSSDLQHQLCRYRTKRRKVLVLARAICDCDTRLICNCRTKELGLPWGQIPILEVDGKVYGQSNAIARYLAKKYNLVGKNEFESLKCDEIVDAFKDYGQSKSQ